MIVIEELRIVYMIYSFIRGLLGAHVMVIAKEDDVGSAKLRYVPEVSCRKRDLARTPLIAKG